MTTIEKLCSELADIHWQVKVVSDAKRMELIQDLFWCLRYLTTKWDPSLHSKICKWQREVNSKCQV